MPWWQGPTVLELLDTFKATDEPQGQPLRFPIQDVYRFDERRILAGRVESGTLRVGDKLVFCPAGKTSFVKTIERWGTSGVRKRFGGRIHWHHAGGTDLCDPRSRRRA